ncbi:hypothetical protein HOY80DRAFT_1103561 [Tuber brumale]|nr:hypothetical protein HOY80DRAFT_1103561 [Tuber brumale]
MSRISKAPQQAATRNPAPPYLPRTPRLAEQDVKGFVSPFDLPSSIVRLPQITGEFSSFPNARPRRDRIEQRAKPQIGQEEVQHISRPIRYHCHRQDDFVKEVNQRHLSYRVVTSSGATQYRHDTVLQPPDLSYRNTTTGSACNHAAFRYKQDTLRKNAQILPRQDPTDSNSSTQCSALRYLLGGITEVETERANVGPRPRCRSISKNTVTKKEGKGETREEGRQCPEVLERETRSHIVSLESEGFGKSTSIIPNTTTTRTRASTRRVGVGPRGVT